MSKLDMNFITEEVLTKLEACENNIVFESGIPSWVLG